MTRLDFVVEKFSLNGCVRYVLSGNMHSPPFSASLYEAYLFARGGGQRGSGRTIMQQLAYLFTWGNREGVDIDKLMLCGFGLNRAGVVSFGRWLKGLKDLRSGEPLSSDYIYKIFCSARKFAFWHVLRNMSGREGNAAVLDTKDALEVLKIFWDVPFRVNGHDLEFSDFDMRCYSGIERYLYVDRISSRESISPQCFRDYLIWRIAWEFGLRIGEILALRLQDLYLFGSDPYLRVVRLDERDLSEYDPRGVYSPKVKTLSRDLGFIDKDSNLPDALEDYVSRFRCWSEIGGSRNLESVPHNYLFVSHGVGCLPLSYSAVRKLALKVSDALGMDFRWHMVRHTFFNKWYSEIPEGDKAAYESLRYWGGWKSEKSLNIYTRRAIRDAAVKGLIGFNRRASI